MKCKELESHRNLTLNAEYSEEKGYMQTYVRLFPNIQSIPQKGQKYCCDIPG
jgi:hypothetical protein